jgi:hypothetical protein
MRFTNVDLYGWFGTITSLIGSFIMAFGLILPAFIMYLVGTILWLYVAIKTHQKSLIVLNFGFLIADIIGIVRNW